MIHELTVEQAREILGRLMARGGDIASAVRAEMRAILSAPDVNDIAENVFSELDSIGVEDCWDRAGARRDGYTAPDEAANDLMEERLQPFFNQAERYHATGMNAQEQIYCMGVILGFYRYRFESKSEFQDYAVDLSIEFAGGILDEWKERNHESSPGPAMTTFLHDRCPQWAEALCRK